MRDPGRYTDGRGLQLFIDKKGNRRWVLRVTIDGQRRDMGLGSANEVSLAEARQRRDKIRRDIRNGVDPIQTKRQQQRVVTFEKYARNLHERIAHEWKNPKHARQWITTLEAYAFPHFGSAPLRDVDGPAIKEALAEIWIEKPETARRVKQRIGRVLSAAIAEGLREGPNPTIDISAALGRKRPKQKHFAAMPYRDAPAFFARLSTTQMTPIARAAFQVLILTASRTSEVLLATWDEIGFAENVWTIPADRMKMGEQHEKPLSAETISILRDVQMLSDGSSLVFPGAKQGTQMSNMVFSAALRRMNEPYTTHGFRSTFRDWAEEQTSYPHAVKEAALAHKLRDKVEAAYRRTTLLEKRKNLMTDWSKFIYSHTE